MIENEKEINVKNINTTALAYMGDSVYEIYIRRHVLNEQSVNVDLLHKKAIMYVKASGQAKALREMLKEENFLSPEETALAKRARNHKTASKAKNADPVDYKNATAFEALIGHLYLMGETKRLEEIIKKAISIIEGEKNE